MANKHDKVPENVIGKFYNDSTCVDCGMCPDVAPLTFKRQDDNSYSYVYRQPVTPEEIAAAREAMDSCPTESIGDDGDEVALDTSTRQSQSS